MPKVTLQFNLPEEKQDAEVAQKAWDLVIVLSEMDNYLRAINKYGHEDFKDPSSCEAAQKIRDKLWELLNNRNIGELIHG